MVPLLDPALERYTRDHTKPPSSLLDELTQVTKERPNAGMQVGPVEGAFLRMLVTLVGARNVLEIGTFTGYSALSMAEALPEGGRLVTCDIDKEVTAIAQSFFDRSPHGKKIEVKLGPAAATLRSFPEGDTFDLVFLDADKSGYLDYYELSLPRLRKGGLLVADNTLWSGAVLNPTTEDAKAIHAFNQRVTSDPRVDNVLLSIRDGIMVTRKL